jgi:hypothetical protein
VDCNLRNSLHLAVTPIAAWPPDRPQQQALPPVPPEQRAQLVEWLVAHHKPLLKGVNNNKSTPLVTAAHHCSDEMLDVLRPLLKACTFEDLAHTTKSGACLGGGVLVLGA